MVNVRERAASYVPIFLVVTIVGLHAYAFLYRFNSFPLTDYDLYSQSRALSDFGVYRILVTDREGTERLVNGRRTYGYSNLIHHSVRGSAGAAEYLPDQERWVRPSNPSELIDALRVRERLPFDVASVRIVHTTANACDTGICIHDEVLFTQHYDK